MTPVILSDDHAHTLIEGASQRNLGWGERECVDRLTLFSRKSVYAP